MSHWKPGFTGATVDALVDFACKEVADARSICVPFFGSGKEVAAFARTDRYIRSADQQYLSQLIVEGVFNADSAESNITEPKYKKGYVFESRPFRSMPDECAGLIDYIATYGTAYDRTALSTAIVRGTYLGLLTVWGRAITVHDTWKIFLGKKIKNAAFVNLPGELEHHHFNVIDNLNTIGGDFDVLYLDPPKVVSAGRDIYSGAFVQLNRALGGPEQEFTRWTSYNYLEYITPILQLPARKTIFCYTSDTNPTREQLESVLRTTGTITHVEAVQHGKRIDYAYVVKR